MLIVLAEARMKDETTLVAARPVFEPMIAASRAEPGCISYAYAQDVCDPDKLIIVERWRDEAALVEHFQTEHMAAFQSALGSLDIEITEIAKYHADDGSPLR